MSPTPVVVAVQGLAACLLVAATYLVPPPVLIRLAHLFPQGADPRLVPFLAQAVVLGVLLAVFRVPLAVASRPSGSQGARAGGWFVTGTLLISLLACTTIAASADPRQAGPSAAELVRHWSDGFPVTGLAGWLVVLVVVGPAFEEFLFRRVIISGIFRDRSPAIALAVSTALFATGHGSWFLSGLLGLALGMLYLRYKSYWLCAAVHSLHNLLAATCAPLLVTYLVEQNVLVPVFANWLVLQISWFAVSLACIAMFIKYLVAQPDLPGSKPSRPPAGLTDHA